MKLTFYIDTYPGMEAKNAYANANPGKKMEGATRYKVEFELPDPHHPDETITDVDITGESDEPTKIGKLSTGGAGDDPRRGHGE